MSILKFSKSASQKNISPKQSGDDILVIKSDKKVINEDEEDTEEIKTLKE